MMPAPARGGDGDFGAAARRTACSRPTKSSGAKGVSAGRLATWVRRGTRARQASSPARMPASGPKNPGGSSARTARPRPAKRWGSPLALSASAPHCGPSRSTTCMSIGLPPSATSPLSAPPMRRASPPSRMRPSVEILVSHCLAPPFPCGDAGELSPRFPRMTRRDIGKRPLQGIGSPLSPLTSPRAIKGIRLREPHDDRRRRCLRRVPLRGSL